MNRRMRAVVVALLALSVGSLSACGGFEQGGEAQAQEEPVAAAPANAEPHARASGKEAAEGASVEGKQDRPANKKQARGKGGGKKARPKPIETLRLAGKKTLEANTAKFTMFISFSGLAQEGAEGPEGFGVRVDGAADFDRNVSKFTMYMPYAGQMKVRQIGNDVYMKLPEYMRERLSYTEPWLKWTADESAEGTGDQSSRARSGTPDDATGGLDYLREVSKGVDEVGKDWVRGVATTHYRAKIDLENVAEGGSPEFRESFREAREQLGIREIPVEAWIDDEGRIRRFNMEISLDTPELREAGVSEDAKLALTQEIYDYGAPVRVQAPPEEDTVTTEEVERRQNTNAA